jgi:glycosyltransferase involved in cell wall biosynthesis
MKKQGELRILGNIGSKGGSKIHRVWLPLKHLDGQEINLNGEKAVIKVDWVEAGDNLDDKLKDADIFYNNFDTMVQAWQIGVKLNKYNVKLIEDVDDVFYLNPDSPSYSLFNAGNVKRHISLADTVVVTNERLKSHIERFTEKRGKDDFLPIHVSGNHLPNEGQWQYKPKEKHNSKVRFGIFGSISHYPDWKLLKGMIKILGNNKKFAQKAKFVIAGHGKDKYWTEILSWFKGLKCEVEYIPFTPSNRYMELLDHVDVVLAPLVDDEFSYCKSSLKIAECAMRDVFLVGSLPYANKDLSCGIALDPEDWQKWIWELLKEDKWYEFGVSFGEKNRNAMDFNKRIESLKDAIAYCYTSDYNVPENLSLYGITYNKDQYTEFNNYDNSEIKTITQNSFLFEYNPIIDIVDNKEIKEYLGIFSWKMPFKTALSKKLVEKLFKECLKSEEKLDIIGFSPTLFNKNYLSFTEKQHPGFMELFNLVCKDLNLEVKEPEHVVYSNFFIAKKEIYSEFVNTIIKPAIELLETKYKDLAWKDANYTSGLKGEELKEQTGLEFYTFHTFILERLMSIWLENRKDLKFKQVG